MIVSGDKDQERIIWEEKPSIPRSKLVFIIGNNIMGSIVSLVFIFQFAVYFDNIIIETLIIIPFELVVIYLAISSIKKGRRQYHVRYFLASNLFIIIRDKKGQNYQKA